MRTNQVVHVVNCHASGEVGDVIVGGVQLPAALSVLEKSRFVASDQTLRNFVLNEPRGGVFKHVNLLVPADDPRADVGFVIMEPEDTPLMSGSNTMCVATVVLETGLVPMREPESELVLQAPGGLIHVRARCRDGKAESITLRNLPSYVEQLDAMVEVPGIGTVSVDMVWAGDSYVVTDGRALGFAMVPQEAREISEVGARITQAADDQLSFRHPENDWDHISFCHLTAPAVEENGVVVGLGTVSLQPGKLDRSPSGTGSSARMAVLHARGQVAVGQPYRGRSIIGTEFECTIREEVTYAGRRAIVPEVTGRAWIYGTSQLFLDPDDPFPSGYRVTDTWPDHSKVTQVGDSSGSSGHAGSAN